MVRVARLSSGPVRYRDRGSGPVIVFVHGLLANGTLWREVVDTLGEGFRRVCPDLPLGGHALPMRPTADLSPSGVARLLGEFLDELDLADVTLVATDTGGAVTQLLLAEGCDRVGRVVLTPCDSFDNFLPPSLRPLQILARVPGLAEVAVQPLRLARVRRFAFHWLSKHPVDAAVTAEWTRPLVSDRRIRRDTRRFLAAIDERATLAAAERLRTFDKPVLLLWPRRLPYFPFAHAERWAATFPDARLVEVPDSYTFVCHDQPRLLANEIARFVPPSDRAQVTRRARKATP
nr:alpha/beta fold hydrolase [Amycolatopsis arida]